MKLDTLSQGGNPTGLKGAMEVSIASEKKAAEACRQNASAVRAAQGGRRFWTAAGPCRFSAIALLSFETEQIVRIKSETESSNSKMKILSDEADKPDSQGSLARFLQPLLSLPRLRYEPLGQFEIGGRNYSLPRFTLSGPNSADPIRIGLFGAIHGDEPAGAYALAEFLRQISADSQTAENFELQVYPVCNPTGFEDKTRESRSGKDLNREFWRNSAEPEVQILENELRNGHFSGLIQLHADDTSDGIYGFVKGHTLTENLLRPALREASKIIPRNINATIDGFAARDGIIYDLYQGILAAPIQMDPVPFEIVFETPHSAPMELQVEALVVAIRTILSEYRQLISFAANI